MPENFGGEKGLTPEKKEDQKYQDFLIAEEEEKQILDEISRVLEITPNREEAEKTVLEKYATAMDKAIEKSKSALKEWLDSIKQD